MVRFKKQDGSIVEVHETRVEDFKMQFPNAEHLKLIQALFLLKVLKPLKQLKKK